MYVVQAEANGQGFMRRMARLYNEKLKAMHLPYAYTSMDGACITQSKQIWDIGTTKTSCSKENSGCSESVRHNSDAYTHQHDKSCFGKDR